MELFNRVFKSRAPITIVGVLIVGVICSAIYDAVVKPGFNIVSKVFFDLVTFGSQSVRDYAFGNAALDPTALPSMVIFSIMMGVGFAAILMVNMKSLRFQRRALNAEPQNMVVLTRAEVDGVVVYDENHKDIKLIKRVRYLGWLIDALMIALIFITITVLNQSILVWRIYNANEKIIAPYATENEMLKIKSQFSQVKTEKDYKNLYEEMQKIAVKNKVELRSESVW